MSRRRAARQVTAWATGLALVATVALPRPGWSAAPPPSPPTASAPVSALDEARALQREGDPVAAIGVLEGALADFDPQALRREPDDRAQLLLELSRAREQAYEREGDEQHLQIARDRLRQLLEESEIHGYAAPLVDRALAERDRIDERLLAVPGPETSPALRTTAPPRPTATTLGRGWMIAGGTLLGAGVGVSSLAFVGIAMGSRADASVARTTVPSTEGQRIEAIEQGQRGNRFAVAGTIAASALVAAGIGALLLGVRARRKAQREPASVPLTGAPHPWGVSW